MKQKLLFVCSMNRLRSPTAEVVARQLGIEADSVGIESDAIVPLRADHLRWASRVICMELEHVKAVRAFILAFAIEVPITCWAIPDDYNFMQPELQRIVKRKLEEMPSAGFFAD